MKKNNNYYVAGLVVLLLIPGCGQPDKEKEDKVSGFKTNRSSFLVTVEKNSPNKETRNALMDEFITKSDLQCQQYLSKSLEPSSASSKDNGLYMNIFDTASQIMGVKYITDTAKQMYMSSNDDTKKETKSAYAKALSPEIKRGVEMAREEYAQTKMYSKKYKLIESYTYEMLEYDMKNYDKLCSHEVGLIEINKALKKMQKSPEVISPFTPKLVIDPATIAHKVEAVNKEVEAKNEMKIAPSVEVSETNVTKSPAL